MYTLLTVNMLCSYKLFFIMNYSELLTSPMHACIYSKKKLFNELVITIIDSKRKADIVITQQRIHNSAWP